MVNNNSSWLISYEKTGSRRRGATASAAPGGDREDTVGVSEIARRGGHDGALGKHESAAGLDREPHVLLAHEVERSGTIDRAISRLFSACV